MYGYPGVTERGGRRGDVGLDSEEVVGLNRIHEKRGPYGLQVWFDIRSTGGTRSFVLEPLEEAHFMVRVSAGEEPHRLM